MSTPLLSRKTVIVEMENGLHLVPCGQIAEAARRHTGGDVRVRKGTVAVDAKNVLDLMTLRAERGTTLELEASGPGGADIVEAIVRLFECQFEVRKPGAT